MQRRHRPRGQREHRQREAQEAVGAELQQHAGQDHRAARRRLDVRVGQPGVQREDRHLDGEGQRERPEAQQLRRVRQRQVRQRDVVEAEAAGGGVVLHVEVEDRHQHQQRADQRVDHELDRRVEPPLAAPDPDDEVHRDQHQLPEDVEDEQVQRDEGADHAGLEHQHGDDELAHADVADADGLRRQQRQRHQEGRQQHQPQRDAVDAQVEADAERLDPDLVDLQLEPGLRGVEVAQDEQRHQERHQRRAEAEAAVDRLLFARHQHDQRGAEERQQRDPAEDAHQRTSTFCLRSLSVCQRGSRTVTRIV